MEETLEKVREELRAWRDKRGEVVRALETLADTLQDDYENYKFKETVGLGTSIVSGALGIGALISLPVPGLPILFALPSLFLGAAGGATKAVATIHWNAMQKEKLDDAERLVEEDHAFHERLIEHFKELQDILKEKLPPALQEDHEQWKMYWEQLLKIIPFSSLVWAGVHPHVRSGILVCGSTLGENVPMVEEFGVVPWEFLSAGSQVLTKASGAATVGFLVYDVKELIHLVNSDSPEKVQQVRDVAQEMEKHCLSEAEIETVINELHNMIPE